MVTGRSDHRSLIETIRALTRKGWFQYGTVGTYVAYDVTCTETQAASQCC